jgi:signal transduction histidine kinase
VWVVAASVLHELNNPLHAMGLLLDEYQTCAPSDVVQRTDLVQRVQAHVRRMLSHLETLRAMQNHGEPDEQRIALDELIGTLVADINALSRAEGIVVHAECRARVFVVADPGYLRTVLENLLDNSLHSVRASGGGNVTISLDTNAEHAIVSVRDDGPPLEPNAYGALFDPLRTTKRNGLGLGLSIARALARAMDGDLLLGTGLEKSFRLELPIGGSS